MATEGKKRPAEGELTRDENSGESAVKKSATASAVESQTKGDTATTTATPNASTPVVSAAPSIATMSSVLQPSTFSFAAPSFAFATNPQSISATLSGGLTKSSSDANPFAVKDAQAGVNVPSAATGDFLTPAFKWGSAGPAASASAAETDKKEAKEDRKFGEGLPAPATASSPSGESAPPIPVPPAAPLQMSEEHTTGEEKEEHLYRKKARVYVLEKATGNAPAGWRERGTGTLHINRMEDKRRIRAVMRIDGVHRLVLNTVLFPDMALRRMDDRKIQMSCFQDGLPVSVLLRVERREDGDELLAALTKYKAIAPPLHASTAEPVATTEAKSADEVEGGAVTADATAAVGDVVATKAEETGESAQGEAEVEETK
eukprot:TRINITY_DN15713_c0_g1_i1.p1 TRINITY_DN15713_c0_g1~~TRINITY_DN15713_c0_g1_i1.p1  ORF type:complete len:374 (+),score=86.98 TRINITY_DN15713_c0_g1_i1:87-1208(+)